MHWSALIVFAIISGLTLWLSSKFFGKKGLAYVALLNFIIGYMLVSSSILVFSVPVSGVLIFLMTVLFVVFLFYKKYALKDVMKLLITMGVAVAFIGLIQTISCVYVSTFYFAWNFALFPMLAVLVSVAVAIVVGYLIDKYAKFIKDYSLKNFISLAVATFSLILVFNLFTLTGDVSFGNFLLSWLISLIVSVLFVLGLMLMDKLGLFVEKTEIKKFDKLQKKVSKEIIVDEIEEE